MKTKKITKKVREEAWLICAIGASAEGFVCIYEIQNALDIDSAGTENLACHAYHCPAAAKWPMFSSERYAEAAALLAEGWTP